MSDSTSNSVDNDHSMDSLDDDNELEENEELYCGCEDCYWHCLNSNLESDDEEAFLFHFNPIADVELLCNADIGTMSYFALFELAGMISSILGAWKRRKSMYSLDAGYFKVSPYKKDMYNICCSA